MRRGGRSVSRVRTPRRGPRLQLRMLASLAVLTLLAGVLLGRLGQLQLTDHPAGDATEMRERENMPFEEGFLSLGAERDVKCLARV